MGCVILSCDRHKSATCFGFILRDMVSGIQSCWGFVLRDMVSGIQSCWGFVLRDMVSGIQSCSGQRNTVSEI